MDVVVDWSCHWRCVYFQNWTKICKYDSLQWA